MTIPRTQNSCKPPRTLQGHCMQVIAVFQFACIVFLEADDIPSLRRDGSFHCLLWHHGMMCEPQTNSTLVIFIYLMMNHPEVQHRAQAEIDRVVGQQRLPDFEDRPSLPYVGAVLRETMRWHPVTAIGVFNSDVGFLDLLMYSSSSCHRGRRCLSRVSHSTR